jgi:hypothetical protein
MAGRVILFTKRCDADGAWRDTLTALDDQSPLVIADVSHLGLAVVMNSNLASNRETAAYLRDVATGIEQRAQVVETKLLAGAFGSRLSSERAH